MPTMIRDDDEGKKVWLDILGKPPAFGKRVFQDEEDSKGIEQQGNKQYNPKGSIDKTHGKRK